MIRSRRHQRAQGLLEYIMLMGMVMVLAVAALKPARDGLLGFYMEQRGCLVFPTDSFGDALRFIYFNMY